MATLKDIKAYFSEGEGVRNVTAQEIKDLTISDRDELKVLLDMETKVRS